MLAELLLYTFMVQLNGWLFEEDSNNERMKPKVKHTLTAGEWQAFQPIREVLLCIICILHQLHPAQTQSAVLYKVYLIKQFNVSIKTVCTVLTQFI